MLWQCFLMKFMSSGSSAVAARCSIQHTSRTDAMIANSWSSEQCTFCSTWQVIQQQAPLYLKEVVQQLHHILEGVPEDAGHVAENILRTLQSPRH